MSILFYLQACLHARAIALAIFTPKPITTAYEPPSESEETARPPTRANTAPELSLEHNAEGLERPARARTAPVPRHTGPETDAIGNTPMGDECEAPGTAGCAG